MLSISLSREAPTGNLLDLTVKLENGVRGFFYTIYFTTYLVIIFEKRYIFIKEQSELNV